MRRRSRSWDPGMRVPDTYGPSEGSSDAEIQQWLAHMVKLHLLKKRYKVENGVGDWVYTNTWLATWIHIPLLQLRDFVLGPFKRRHR